jgi:hypothetical protein
LHARIRPIRALTRAQVQPGLFYAFITTAHFEEHEHPAGSTAPSAAASHDPTLPVRASLLTPADLALAHQLQTTLLEAFAPTLFQAPAASHMACTDAFADAWLSAVIPGAMAPSRAPDHVPEVIVAAGTEAAVVAPPVPVAATGAAMNGTEPDLAAALDLGRPMESLAALARVDWAARGVCDACAEGRREEWAAEREALWARVARAVRGGATA